MRGRGPVNTTIDMSDASDRAADVARFVDVIRRKYDDGCFACGRDNPLGMHLDHFDRSPDGAVTARFRPRPDYRGTFGVLHGGIAATALDEIMVWAGILGLGVMSVTGTLDLRYSAVATMDDAFIVSGRVDEVRGKRLRVAGTLHAENQSRASVTASGLYLISEDVTELLESEGWER